MVLEDLSGLLPFIRKALPGSGAEEPPESENNVEMSTNTPAIQGWPISKDDYELNNVIGVGSTAVVYSAYCKPRQEKCAIKRIHLEKSNISIEALSNEIKVMSLCNHENVVTYHTSFVVQDELWLVQKLLEGGSFMDITIHKVRATNCKYGVFDESTIATVLKEVLHGLVYFHSNGKIHRDIKASNIMLGENGTVQITDFGVSTWLAIGRDRSRPKKRHTFVGTPCWMAPEVMESMRGYDFKADIWSFGITAIELATGNAPYQKYPPMKAIMLTLKNDPPTLETGAVERNQYKAYSRTFRNMVADCLQKDPTKRPTATELLKHPFFKKAKDRQYLQSTLVTDGPRLHKVINSVSDRRQGTAINEWVWDLEDEEEAEKPMNNIETDNNSSGDDRQTESEAPSPSVPIKLRLRIRNQQMKLNDINFEFIAGMESAEDIAVELVKAGLVDAQDSVVVAANLQKLISSNGQSKRVTFPLISGEAAGDVLNENSLHGFASLLLID